MHLRRAFTLIELLIVVAIIAILAAIAVPNFLEAQVRSKVSRVKADLRTLTTALEAYAVDYNKYPDIARGSPSFNPPSAPLKSGSDFDLRALPKLSTPVSYITSSIMTDPFKSGIVEPKHYTYLNAQATQAVPDLQAIGIIGPYQYEVSAFQAKRYVIRSIGPDTYDYVRNPDNDPEQGALKAYTYFVYPNGTVGNNYVYDTTNGTVSVGDVFRTGDGQIN